MIEPELRLGRLVRQAETVMRIVRMVQLVVTAQVATVVQAVMVRWQTIENRCRQMMRTCVMRSFCGVMMIHGGQIEIGNPPPGWRTFMYLTKSLLDYKSRGGVELTVVRCS